MKASSAPTRCRTSTLSRLPAMAPRVAKATASAAAVSTSSTTAMPDRMMVLAMVESRRSQSRWSSRIAVGTSRRSAAPKPATSGPASAVSFSTISLGTGSSTRSSPVPSHGSSSLSDSAFGTARTVSMPATARAMATARATSASMSRRESGRIWIVISLATAPRHCSEARAASTAAPALSAARKVRIAITAMSARAATESTGTRGWSRRRLERQRALLPLGLIGIGLVVRGPREVLAREVLVCEVLVRELRTSGFTNRHGDDRRRGRGAARRRAPSRSSRASRSRPRCRATAIP